MPPSQIQLNNVDPIGMIIQQVQIGQYMPIPSNINLYRGEIVLYTTQVTLAEDRKSSKRVGSSAGASVSLGHGMRVHSGSYHGHTISTIKLTKIDQGFFNVTTQRLVFTGARGSVVLPTNKVLNTILYKDGVEVRVENRQKREVFLCAGPKLLNTYIIAAIRLAAMRLPSR